MRHNASKKTRGGNILAALRYPTIKSGWDDCLNRQGYSELFEKSEREQERYELGRRLAALYLAYKPDAQPGMDMVSYKRQLLGEWTDYEAEACEESHV